MSEVETIEKKIQKSYVRQDIMNFESMLMDHPEAFKGDTINCPLKHSFSDGIYVREIFIPAGTILTGKIHKHEHPNFLMSGEVEVFTESEGMETLKAPLSMISKPGTKRVVKTLTDTTWITCHHNPTNTQNLDKLEKIVIAKSYSEYEKFKKLSEGKVGRFISTIKKIILCLG